MVQTFPKPNGKWQISTNGGAYPRWSADGKELYFITGDKLMVSSIHATGDSLEAGTPVSLFSIHRDNRSFTGGYRPPYAVSPDGRFLVNQQVEVSADNSPITLILNWSPKDSK